jgi:hypothetical protein
MTDDPRVEALAEWFFFSDFDSWETPDPRDWAILGEVDKDGCRQRARSALAVADAVDPLRTRRVAKHALIGGWSIEYEPIHTSWQPIETAPKDGTRILALTEIGITIIHWGRVEPFGTEDEWTTDSVGPGYSFGPERVTHWMPLPAPPLPTHGDKPFPPAPPGFEFDAGRQE